MVVPAASPALEDAVDHLEAVRSDLTEVCELGWIDDSGTCETLGKKLTRALDALEEREPRAARRELRGFLTELETGREGAVGGNAYWLLAPHVGDILGRI